jgi:hypothetical protein
MSKLRAFVGVASAATIVSGASIAAASEQGIWGITEASIDGSVGTVQVSGFNMPGSAPPAAGHVFTANIYGNGSQEFQAGAYATWSSFFGWEVVITEGAGFTCSEFSTVYVTLLDDTTGQYVEMLNGSYVASAKMSGC